MGKTRSIGCTVLALRGVSNLTAGRGSGTLRRRVENIPDSHRGLASFLPVLPVPPMMNIVVAWRGEGVVLGR